jgi:hypothetical protein
MLGFDVRRYWIENVVWWTKNARATASFAMAPALLIEIV